MHEQVDRSLASNTFPALIVRHEQNDPERPTQGAEPFKQCNRGGELGDVGDSASLLYERHQRLENLAILFERPIAQSAAWESHRASEARRKVGLPLRCISEDVVRTESGGDTL